MLRNRSASQSRQRGLSFIGVIFIGLIAVAAFAIGGQSLPIFLEYQAINKAANKAAKEGTTTSALSRAVTWKSASAMTRSWCPSSTPAKSPWRARPSWSIALKDKPSSASRLARAADPSATCFL